MELFTERHRVPPLWYKLDAFIHSLPDGPALDPVVRRAADYRIMFMTSKSELSIDITEPSTCSHARPQLVSAGLWLAQDLLGVAEGLASCSGTLPSSPSSNFNEYIRSTNDANAAVASCLYLTIRLHVLEMVLHLTKTPSFRPHTIQPETPDPIGPLLKQISIALGDGSDQPCRDRPGAGSLAFTLFWPLSAASLSTLATEQEKAWARHGLSKIGTLSGLGLAMKKQGDCVPLSLENSTSRVTCS